MNSYTRYILVDPVEGVLISYQSESKYPHTPSYIIKLNEIKECGVLLEERQSKWFFKRDQFYFIVRSDAKTSYFFLDKLELAQFWTQEIHEAIEFYNWFLALKNLRYDPAAQADVKKLEVQYDFIIDNVIAVNLPECDIDQYK